MMTIFTRKARKLIFFMCCSVTQFVSAQDEVLFDWVSTVEGINGDLSSAVTIDTSGNVISTGYFGCFSGGAVDFTFEGTTVTLTSNGSCDIYVHKVDNNGNLLWIRQFGSDSGDQGLCATTDIAGNVYVTGSFVGTVDFDPGPMLANLTADGADGFVLKLDPNGELIWVKQIEGPGLQKGLSIHVDVNENVLICGDFWSTSDFDPSSAVANLTADGADGFVLKLDSTSNYVWAKQIGGLGNETATSVTTDSLGNVYTTGANFDGDEIYIQKLNPIGNILWMSQIGPLTHGRGYSIHVDAFNNVYVTGQFYGMADFDPGPGTAYLNSSSSDIFILKLTSAGSLIWVKQIGANGGNEIGTSLTTDPNGNLYITGWFHNTINFNPGFFIANLTAQNTSDIFILNLTSFGDFNWVKQITSAWGCDPRSIALDDDNNIFISGSYRDVTDFDPSEGVELHTGSVMNGPDAFTLKLRYCALTYFTETVNTCEPYTWTNGITYTSTGIYRDTLTNAAGCDSIRTLYLTVNTVANTVNLVEGVTYSSNTNNASYQWLDCTMNYSEISSETGQNFIASYNGSYAVAVNLNGCADTSECFIVNNVGLDALNFEENFVVFPNPTNSNIYIQMQTEISDVVVTLRDLTGKILMRIEPSSKELMLPMTDLSNGIYLLDIRSGGGDTLNVRVLKK